MVAPYLAGITNHGMMDEMMKMMDSRFIWHVQWTPSRIQIDRLKIILQIARICRSRRYTHDRYLPHIFTVHHQIHIYSLLHSLQALAILAYSHYNQVSCFSSTSHRRICTCRRVVYLIFISHISLYSLINTYTKHKMYLVLQTLCMSHCLAYVDLLSQGTYQLEISCNRCKHLYNL